MPCTPHGYDRAPGRPIKLQLSISDALALRRLLSAARIDLRHDSSEAEFADRCVVELQGQVCRFLFPKKESASGVVAPATRETRTETL